MTTDSKKENTINMKIILSISRGTHFFIFLTPYNPCQYVTVRTITTVPIERKLPVSNFT